MGGISHNPDSSMEFLTRSASVRDRIRIWRAAGTRVALVPTSGTLHKGHMSLVAEAQERADHVIVSIFADPREREAPTLEADRELLQKMGASVVFVPPSERALAPRLYAILSEFAAIIDAGARDYEALQRQGMESLAAAGFAPEYFAIRQAADLAAGRNRAREL